MRHYAGENFHRIQLLALGGEARLSGAAAIQIALDVLVGQRQQRRAAVDHAADRDPMAFAEGRDPEHVAEGVERHGVVSGQCKSILTCRNAEDLAGQTPHSSCPALPPSLKLRRPSTEKARRSL